jgi:hypothetical protein
MSKGLYAKRVGTVRHFICMRIRYSHQFEWVPPKTISSVSQKDFYTFWLPAFRVTVLHMPLILMCTLFKISRCHLLRRSRDAGHTQGKNCIRAGLLTLFPSALNEEFKNRATTASCTSLALLYYESCLCLKNYASRR